MSKDCFSRVILLSFQNYFLEFSPQNLSSFSHTCLNILLYPSSRDPCMWECLFVVKKCSQSFHPYIWRNRRGCGLSELARSSVLFLREQVRELLVQSSWGISL